MLFFKEFFFFKKNNKFNFVLVTIKKKKFIMPNQA